VVKNIIYGIILHIKYLFSIINVCPVIGGSFMSEEPLYDVEEFWKFKMRVGLVKKAERIPKSKKLIKLTVDFGDHERTIVAGIGDQYNAEDLEGKKMIFVVNLKPKKLMGVESQGMLVVAEDEKTGKVYLITVDDAPVGAKVW